MWLLLAGSYALGEGSRFAVRFYGTGTGQIDRIKIPLASAPQLNVGGDFTIEFWMRARYADNAGTVAPGLNGDGWITGNVIVDRDVYGGGDYGDFGVAMGRQGGTSVLAFGVHNGSWGETIVGTNHVGDDRWRHVAVTRRETNGQMRIFVDGVLDAEGTGPSGNVSYRVGRSTAWPKSDPFLVLGAEKHDAGPAYPSFRGYMDEIRIWSRVLEGPELSALADRIFAPSAVTGLVASFRLEEGTNRVVRDVVFGYTGTLFSARTGNGEWIRWMVSSNTAPLQAYAPELSAHRAPTQALVVRWFAAENIAFDVEAATSLAPTAHWAKIGHATNLIATNAIVGVVVAPEGTPNRFLRVVGRPYR